MLIAVVTAKDYINAKRQIELALSQSDGIELRLDYWNKLDIDLIAELRREFKVPTIFTLRKKSQGGFYPNSESQRLEDILKLCELQPEYIDLEYDTPDGFLQTLYKSYPNVKLISSYHDFDQTPDDLEKILKSMQHPAFSIYKIAAKANFIIDSFRMLKFCKKYSEQYLLTAISMGEHGSCTRILGPIVGSQMSYASLNDTETSAPGQLTLESLNNIYHIRKLNTASKIYALLGDPIGKSVGHILHNQVIEILQKNAVYIKLQTKPDELREVIQYCRDLPFSGFSITMPLKKAVVNLLDSIDTHSQQIKAINSIVIDYSSQKIKNKWIGFNTDGLGAINSILEKTHTIFNKTIVILGAGGAARAIAYEAIQQGAKVIILNRTLEKAKNLSDDLGLSCEAYSFDDKNKIKSIDYDVIINTLPFGILPPDYLPFIAHKIAMDIVYNPINTPFLEIAKKSNCVCIPGYEMYIRQAILQIERWFHPTIQEILNIKNMMENYFSVV